MNENRRLTFTEAVFVAALPYRKSVYAAGGFAQTGGPAEPAHWNNFLRTYFPARDLARAQNETNRNTAAGYDAATLRYVSIWDAEYPQALRFIYDPPPVLFYSGTPPPGLFATDGERIPAVGIVGTRNPHPLAVAAVHEFVAELARNMHATPSKINVTQSKITTDEARAGRAASAVDHTRRGPMIVSGFARGIDREAHLAALDAGLPGVAVLGAGLLHAGPRSNFDVLRRARENHVPLLLLSEFPPHTVARAAFFPRRNRIIAGLVEQVAVLQAPAKSGAIITARFALDEGRDVLAFDHAMLVESPGCNDGARVLIEAGARLIELPALEARIRKEPAFGARGRSERLELWTRAALGDGMRWLGGRYYLADSRG